MTITYGSVCSGIEAASIAWESLGWKPAWFAQFDPEHNYARQPDFPSRVLAHHWPDVPNLGDMTQIADLIRWGAVAAPDVLVGGTPCQAFSVAGMRKGLKDPRGQLTISFGELADAIDEQRDTPCTIVWENVPGVLNSKDNAFGCFLALLAGESCELQPPGRKWTNAGCVSGPKRVVAWRVLDAQYFGVAQRRRRVFVIASADPNFDPTAILFESDSVRRDTPPSRETGSQVAALTANGVGTCGEAQAGHLIAAFGGGNTTGQIDVATTCTAHGNRQDFDTETFAVQSYGIAGNTIGRQPGNGGNGTGFCEELSYTLTRTDQHGVAVAFNWAAAAGNTSSDLGMNADYTGTLQASTHPAVCNNMQVRRLMPVECERLQGFPEHKISVKLSVHNEDTSCSESQKKIAPVATKNPKLLKYVFNVEDDELNESVKSALWNSAPIRGEQNEPVAVNVLIDLEQKLLQILNVEKSVLSVSIAETKNESLLLMPNEDFVQLVALMTQTWVKITKAGKAVSAVDEMSFSNHLNGKLHNVLYGQEIRELVNDAGKFTNTVKDYSKFITSQVGQSSLNSEQMFATLSYFVAAVIAGCIPEQTLEKISFVLNLTISYGHTDIPGAKDGPRYKALGNSMAVPVMRWIGHRIKMYSPH